MIPSLLLAGWSGANPAHACGGFFCNAAQPVDQAAEEVLFALEDDRVNMHVRISYSGAAEDFAWVVPVPGEPELAVGTDALFGALSSLRARFVLGRDFGDCDLPFYSSSTTDAYSGGGGGVDIVSRGVVGPYETAVLKAESSEELLDWLQTAGFDLPDSLESALAPYVAQGQHFVALRLAKDKGTGDLAPLSMTWRGDQLSIPIQLTSVAATPDMRLRVYLLGEHRAVPESYLHVEINPLAVDWWSGGANLDEVITRAADEAGGHGFFTDYAGPPTPARGQVHDPGWDTAPALIATVTDAATLLRFVLDRDLPLDDPMMAVLSDHLGLPESGTPLLDLDEVLNCLQPSGGYGYYSSTTTTDTDPEDCYADELAAIEFDPEALAADVESVVLEPRRRAEALLGSHPWITRLTSSVSPHEMTVDPTFVFNASMPEVPLQRSATERYSCAEGESIFDAPRQLSLPDGRLVMLPSLDDLGRLGMSEIEWLESRGLTEPATVRIERTTAEGDPEVLRDNTDLLWSQLGTLFEGGVPHCGCSGAGRAATAPLAAGLALLALRRRRQGQK